MVKGTILTDRERNIIEKKLKETPLTQNESNILSKQIRPKLQEIKEINAKSLLTKLRYNQKARSIEQKIRKFIVSSLPDIKAIIVYGSAIQTNYTKYNDIDVLVITNRKIWKTQGEKYDLVSSLTKKAEARGLRLDIQLLNKDALYREYPHNPSLIYQLKDCKLIHGKMKLPSKVALSKLDLRMKLDWSDIDDEDSYSTELYQSLRNLILVRLLVQKIVDNEVLREQVAKSLGEAILDRLKNNTASKAERRLALNYIRELSQRTDKEIRTSSWEKIVL